MAEITDPNEAKKKYDYWQLWFIGALLFFVGLPIVMKTIKDHHIKLFQ
jgi:hypothetical protein